VLAGCFSRRSVIDAHPLHCLGDVSKAIEAATMILRASVRHTEADWSELAWVDVTTRATNS
jgi:hypothetical protein